MRTIVKGNINQDQISLVTHGANHESKEYLFTDNIGNDIYVGDTVQFNIEKQTLPASGIINNVQDLRIHCWNTIMSRSEDYIVEEVLT